jgi:16S rRNA (cytosine967-C5)-methyltransferase
LFALLAADLGAEEAAAFVEGVNAEAPVGVWLRRPAPQLSGSDVPGIPGARYLSDVNGLGDAVATGEVLVSDPASRAVALAVDARPGEKVVDLAAAPGGKTAQLWAAMGGQGELIGVDRHPRRLAAARKRLAKAGIRPVWMEGDARRPPPGLEGADAVLLDAPCSGLGTLRRRPEIRHRVAPAGGRLVYSACTVTAAETVHQVAGLPAAPPQGLPGRVWGSGLLLAPHITGTDGMFISIVRP